MEIKPDAVGIKSFFLNPGVSQLTSTHVAAVDNALAYTAASIQPYAYTATVADTYDARNFSTDDAGSNLVTVSRNAAESALVEQKFGRESLVSSASSGIRDVFRGVGYGAGRGVEGALGLNDRVAKALARPIQAAGSAAGDFVGRNEGKVRHLLSGRKR